jgi:pimeloyl-ACP methyl ester carboxylesterase
MATNHRDPTPAGDRANATVTAWYGDDRQLAYAEYGDPSGTPVAFLHGTPGSRLLGRLLDDPARERGIRLLAPDRPGYGRSSPWPSRSLDDAGATVAALLDDAGVESAGLVAFSGGGPRALATAATHPDRVGRVDVVAGATPPETGETPAVQRLLGRLADGAPAVMRALFRGQSWLANRLGPSLVVGQYTSGDADGVADDVAAVVGDDFVEAFSRSRRGAVTEFRNVSEPWTVSLGAVEAPVALWHGDADANVPVGGARRLASRLPDARLHVLDGADHLRTLLRAVPDALDGQRRHVRESR